MQQDRASRLAPVIDMAARAERMGGMLEVVSGVSGTRLTVVLTTAVLTPGPPLSAS